MIQFISHKKSKRNTIADRAFGIHESFAAVRNHVCTLCCRIAEESQRQYIFIYRIIPFSYPAPLATGPVIINHGIFGETQVRTPPVVSSVFTFQLRLRECFSRNKKQQDEK